MVLHVTVATATQSAQRHAATHAARLASHLPPGWKARVASSDNDIVLAIRGTDILPEEAREAIATALQDPALADWQVSDVQQLAV